MELPNCCKYCKEAKDDCPILFKCKRTKQNSKKRFFIKNCPCKECIVKPTCTIWCELAESYFNHSMSMKLADIYFYTPEINWVKRKCI